MRVCFILFYSLCSIISNQLGSKLNTNNLDYCDREPKLVLAECFSYQQKKKAGKLMQYQLTSKFISYDIYNLTFHAHFSFYFLPFP